ncbi:meiotically up-regulated gene 113-domain-containing protein [Fusarium acuminatum]|uniref:Meiotically up-regulated gene 113-domain-containing protein n=1 Tax=Fusarium acuminatum TaxID=5515 RepID=A0ABZ2WUI3_9HYPO
MIPTTSSTTLQQGWPSSASTLCKLLEIDLSIDTNCRGYNTTKTKARCKLGISKANCAVITQLLEQIVLIQSFSAAKSMLTQVAHLAMCRRYHRDQGPGRLLLWESILKPLEVAIIKKEDGESKPLSETTTERVPVFASVVAVKQERIPKNETPRSDTTSRQISRPSLSTQIKTSPQSTPTKQTASTDSKSKHVFENYGLARSIKHINEEIKKKLLRPLSTEEKKLAGHVYIYTFPESYHDAHPYIKIGYATDVKVRMARWKSQCGYPPELLGQFPAEHYAKVEKLVHAQLWNQRKREKDGCPTCGVKHKEWFKVDTMTVNKNIGLWTSWMRQQPYNDDGVLQDKWRVRIEGFDMADPSCWEYLATGVFDEDAEESNLTEEGDSFAWSSDEQSDFSDDDILEEVDTDDSGLYSTDEDENDTISEDDGGEDDYATSEDDE